MSCSGARIERAGNVRWWKGSPNFYCVCEEVQTRGLGLRTLCLEPLFVKNPCHQSHVGNLKPLFDERYIPNLEGGIGGGAKGTEWDGGRSGTLVGSDWVEKIETTRGDGRKGDTRSATWKIVD